MPAIDIIQGAQWGSEAKGMVAGALALQRGYDYAVRTGAINAGHTVYYQGRPYAMQQLPVAWVYPDTKLVIGPGAYVHLPTLYREIEWIKDATGVDPSDRIFIDWRVAVHLDSYSDESKAANRHALIGATGKGCAEAIIHKIKDRGVQDLLLCRYVDEGVEIPVRWQWADVPEMLTRAYRADAKIMLEGTQGEQLDFHLGPWPYVTSRQTTPAAWVAEAGLSPTLQYSIILVARTFPIRVAGNSGPMPMEISWPILADYINSRLDAFEIKEHPLRISDAALQDYAEAVLAVAHEFGVNNAHEMLNWTPADRVRHKEFLSQYSALAMRRISIEHNAELHKLFELTTVTKKLRRIARLDGAELDRTIERLQPDAVVLTFLNYQFPELHCEAHSIPEYARTWAYQVAQDGVDAVTTGPLPEHFHWL